MPELIDTLWNVNSLYLFRLLKVFTELIDTLWNVNYRGATKGQIEQMN